MHEPPDRRVSKYPFVVGGIRPKELSLPRAPESYQAQLQQALRDPVSYGGAQKISRLLNFMAGEFLNVVGAVTCREVRFREASALSGFTDNLSLRVHESLYSPGTILQASLHRDFVSPVSILEPVVLSTALIDTLPKDQIVAPSLVSNSLPPTRTIGLLMGQRLEIPMECFSACSIGLGYIANWSDDQSPNRHLSVGLSWEVVAEQRTGMFGSRKTNLINVVSDYEKPACLRVDPQHPISLKPKHHPEFPSISIARVSKNGNVTLELSGPGNPGVMMAVRLSKK